MKNKLNTLLIVVLNSVIVGFYSCNKTETIPTQNFLESLLADSVFINPKIFTQTSYLEIGSTFQVIKAGKITKIGVKAPNTGSFIVTLWDANLKTILLSKTIDQTTAGKKTWINIDSFKLEVNKKYLISVLFSGSYYLYSPSKLNIYPYSKNNILYLGCFASSTTVGASKFPLVENKNIYAGEYDFTFQPD